MKIKPDHCFPSTGHLKDGVVGVHIPPILTMDSLNKFERTYFN